MVICPYCREEVKDGAIVCRYCGRDLPQEDKLNFEETLTRLSLQAQERYEIKEELGHGGMGVVLKAYDRKLKRHVALKILSDELNRNPTAIARFEKEAILAASLDHPNIITIYDIEKKAEKKYISMTYIEGETLRKFLDKRKKSLSVAETVHIVRQICDALSYAHQNGVIHRDIKPSNIMLDKRGRVIVADFGIAKATLGTTKLTLTTTGTTLGTPHYMSPEQAEGKEIDKRADIYSLGVVLYEMLTGRVPFEADTPVALGIKHIREEPIHPRNLNPDIPEEVESIILKSLSKNPTERYDDAQQLADELSSYQEIEESREEIISTEEKVRLLNETKSKIQSLFEQEDFESAEGKIKEVLKILPSENELLDILNSIPEKIKNRDIRIKLEKARESFDKRNFKEALYLCEEVLALDKTNEEADSIFKDTQNELSIIEEMFTEANNLVAACRYSEAIERFNKIIEINPNHEEAKLGIERVKGTLSRIESLTNTAKRYFEENRYNLAYKNWEKALNLNPADEEIKKRLEEVKPIVAKKIRKRRGIIFSIISCFILILIGGRHLFLGFKIVSNGMVPTIFEGDRVIGMRIPYFLKGPQRGDIIIFKSPSEDSTKHKIFVGRIIGLPGEIVEIKDGNAIVNNQEIANPTGIYYYNEGKYGDEKINIPSNSFYILNDNSASANDSRYWGVLPRENIICRVIKIKHQLKNIENLKSLQGKISVDSKEDIVNIEEYKTLKGHKGSVRSTVISPDGKYLASGSEDNTVKIWNMETFEELHTLTTDGHVCSSLAFNPDGKYLTGGIWNWGTRDSKWFNIIIWQTDNFKEIKRLGKGKIVHCLVFSPDGKDLWVGGEDRILKWNMNTYELIHNIGDFSEWLSNEDYKLMPDIYALAISSDGKYLAYNFDASTCKIRDLRSNQLRATLKHYRNSISNDVSSLAFSPNGRYLVSGGHGKVVIWDTSSFEEVKTLARTTGPVAISSTGRYLASTNYDDYSIIDIWDLNTFEKLKTLKGHNGSIKSFSFSPSREYLISGSEDNTIKIWKMPTAMISETVQSSKPYVKTQVEPRIVDRPKITKFEDDLESYQNGELINGKPNWESSDKYYSKGWYVYETARDGVRCNAIMFHPSPWPGGFSLDSNWATFHCYSPQTIESLYVDVEYSCNTKSEIKTYISGDNQTWLDITAAIGMVSPLGEGNWAEAKGDLTQYISRAKITNEVYIKFTSAAYSGSGWGAAVDQIKVNISKQNMIGSNIYTIQVASYEDYSTADEFALKLKKEGYDAFMVDPKQGKYYIICIGYFSNNAEASKTLDKLRVKYKDSFIRICKD